MVDDSCIVVREEIDDGGALGFEDEGPLELTVRRIAVQLGVSHAAVYHHFEDCTAILAGVAEVAFGRLGEAMVVRQSVMGGTALERFAATGLAYAKFALKIRASTA